MRLSLGNVAKITIAAVIGILALKWLATKFNVPVIGPAIGKV